MNRLLAVLATCIFGNSFPINAAGKIYSLFFIFIFLFYVIHSAIIPVVPINKHKIYIFPLQSKTLFRLLHKRLNIVPTPFWSNASFHIILMRSCKS